MGWTLKNVEYTNRLKEWCDEELHRTVMGDEWRNRGDSNELCSSLTSRSEDQSGVQSSRGTTARMPTENACDASASRRLLQNGFESRRLDSLCLGARLALGSSAQNEARKELTAIPGSERNLWTDSPLFFILALRIRSHLTGKLGIYLETD